MKRLETSTKIVDLIMNRQGIPSCFLTSKFPIISESVEALGVMGIIQYYHQHREKFPAEQELKKALSHIHHRFWEKVAISELSKTCDLSLCQFERKIKEHLNITLSSKLLKLEFMKRATYLAAPPSPSGTSPFTLGFYDKSSFTVQKKTKSLTPLQYRKQFI